MTVDFQFLANLAAIVVFGVIGYFYRQLVNDIQKLSSTNRMLAKKKKGKLSATTLSSH